MRKLLAKAEAEKFAIYGQNIANEESHIRDDQAEGEKNIDKTKVRVFKKCFSTNFLIALHHIS